MHFIAAILVQVGALMEDRGSVFCILFERTSSKCHVVFLEVFVCVCVCVCVCVRTVVIQAEQQDLLPDPSWPVAQQLEFALRKLGEHGRTILETQASCRALEEVRPLPRPGTPTT